MSDDITVFVSSHAAWGKDDHDGDALKRMVEHWRSDFNETEQIGIVKYRGELVSHDLFGRVEVDGEIVDTEALEVDGEKLEELSGLMVEAEILAEEILVEGESVDQ